jgi:hypothetical protein
MIVNRPYGPIKGTWAIDTNLQIPEALLPPLGVFASLPIRPNLALHTINGSIKGSVFLLSSSSDRAVINADTTWRKVALSVSILIAVYIVSLNVVQIHRWPVLMAPINRLSCLQLPAIAT